MKLKDVMSPSVAVARPADTIQTVARTMAQHDIGSLPVVDGETLLGIVTDRDIAIRAVAKGMGGGTAVSEVMSTDVECCHEDDDLAHVANKMADKQVRRLPVIDGDKRLVGIVALGDLARADKDKRTGDTLEKISSPSNAV